MLTIRLSRIGKRKKPMYRLIISEKTKDPYGKALEILGSYNPFSKDLDVKQDRIAHWISQGAQMSPTVNNLLVEKNIIKGEKVTASKKGKKSAEEIKAEEAKKEAEKPQPKTDEPLAQAKTEAATIEAPKEEAPVEKKEESTTEKAE